MDYQEHKRDYSPGITVQDAYALKNNATLLKLVSPEMYVSRARATYQDKRAYVSSFMGVWEDVMELEAHVIKFGRFFHPLEDLQAKNVCVIGADIRDQLFGETTPGGEPLDPVGKSININFRPFTIVGMYERMESEADRKKREYKLAMQNTRSGPKRESSFYSHGSRYWRKNNTIHIPLNTMWMKFRGLRQHLVLVQPVLEPILQFLRADRLRARPHAERLRRQGGRPRVDAQGAGADSQHHDPDPQRN
jgi:putative ABC transport system permease protein